MLVSIKRDQRVVAKPEQLAGQLLQHGHSIGDDRIASRRDSLSGSSWTVKRSKSKDRPIHVTREHDDQNSREERSKRAQEKRQKVINICLRTMPDVPDAVHQTDEKASKAIPVKPSRTSSEVQRKRLVQNGPMTRAKKPVCFRDTRTKAANSSCEGQSGRHLQTSDGGGWVPY